MTRTKTKAGILTISDRAFSGEYVDQSGPAIVTWLMEVVTSPLACVTALCPDEQPQIEQALLDLVSQGCDLILTTGGTGPAPRDVTPEATKAIMDKELPGFGERMRAISLQYVPTAILSRQTAVIKGKSLIINLPGQPKAISETLDDLFSAVPYCIELMGGPIILTNPSRVQAFRPKSAPPIESLI